MPRYDRPKSSDWVEIRGADDLSMRELDSLYQTDRKAWADVARAVVVEHGMTRKGAPIDLSTDVMGLTVKQWDWLRSCILEAARDEALDPEV
jgi:hypothetical protein